MYKQKKGLAAWAVVILWIGLLAGCSSGNFDTASNKASEQSALMNEAKSDSESNGNSGADQAEADTAVTTSGESESPAGGGFASETAAGTEGFNQKIIYTANLSMQVDELAAAATSLRNAIHQSGGYILQFQDTRHDGEIGSTYTIKVPAAGFMSFIDRVELIKHNDFERNIGGKDVSEEYVDLESRLKARQLVETRLLAMMDKAVKADDLLKFSQQLSEVQLEIERIKGRIRYLDNNVSFSTVELRMYQTDQTLKNESVKKPNLGGRMSDAITGSTKVVWDALNFLLVVLAGAVPVAAVGAVIAVPAFWLYRRKKKETKTAEKTDSDEEKLPPTL
ncbi:DUF4349 domain-containing protein [Paenibacillus sp. PL91]|uniref:DUF4349 domain-containing protein n=1 Tax=Paenibacillus sp. PL91 TaxID=2729538 RepID=UPI00145C4519|nr:DUF4349 domain-containing protein [Paenibacillus sp. PL91]MBC9199863.1 DUF4349 domain-containing protein [Paenibacillus sp. PL91]